MERTITKTTLTDTEGGKSQEAIVITETETVVKEQILVKDELLGKKKDLQTMINALNDEITEIDELLLNFGSR